MQCRGRRRPPEASQTKELPISHSVSRKELRWVIADTATEGLLSRGLALGLHLVWDDETKKGTLLCRIADPRNTLLGNLEFTLTVCRPEEKKKKKKKTARSSGRTVAQGCSDQNDTTLKRKKKEAFWKADFPAEEDEKTRLRLRRVRLDKPSAPDALGLVHQ